MEVPKILVSDEDGKESLGVKGPFEKGRLNSLVIAEGSIILDVGFILANLTILPFIKDVWFDEDPVP